MIRTVTGASLEPHASRRGVLFGLMATAASASFGGHALAGEGDAGEPPRLTIDLVDRVLPAAGIKTETTFGDTVQRLIAAGALDRDKYRAVYASLGALPAWVDRVLQGPSSEPIILSRDTAPYLLNLLWPIGLSNRAKFNAASPLQTLSVAELASTAGWTLGKAENGYVYFNQVEALKLTDDQDALAFVVASQSYRPCCDNSTLFQDCNHGSALLGLIELAASQGAAEGDLFWLALAANSYWFPDKYVQTAQYFSRIEGRSWDEVEPRVVLGERFSSLSGWRQNVYEPLERAKILPAELTGPAACGI